MGHKLEVDGEGAYPSRTYLAVLHCSLRLALHRHYAHRCQTGVEREHRAACSQYNWPVNLAQAY